MTRRAASRTPVRLAAADLPACLRDEPLTLAGLWYLGDPSVLDVAPEQAVAIVGTRSASPYGERTAARLAGAAARAGLVVVSGMARGIDAVAHRAAMDAGGRTVAVQGTGVDVPYPAAHRLLHSEILDNGAVLSEVEPGTKAFPGCFPRRNRIIAGLARVTVVVEAGFKSGAVNTASQALDQGKVVAAVPGPIDDPRSAGTNQLLRDGAQVITDVEDLLSLMGLSTIGTSPRSVAAGRTALQAGPELDADEQAVLASITAGAAGLTDVAENCQLSVRQVSQAVLGLQLRGYITSEGGLLGASITEGV